MIMALEERVDTLVRHVLKAHPQGPAALDQLDAIYAGSRRENRRMLWHLYVDASGQRNIYLHEDPVLGPVGAILQMLHDGEAYLLELDERLNDEIIKDPEEYMLVINMPSDIPAELGHTIGCAYPQVFNINYGLMMTVDGTEIGDVREVSDLLRRRVHPKPGRWRVGSAGQGRKRQRAAPVRKRAGPDH
jgi:hypothetical protein